MKIITDKFFEPYCQQLKVDVGAALDEMKEIELSTASFTFYTSVAVISSSRIEGEQMEMDSYIRHKMQDIEYLPELTEKPNDLYKAYLFAKQNQLSIYNLLQSHILLSQHLLPEKWRGIYRKNEMLVMQQQTGRIQFEAAPFNIIQAEMENLMNDVEELRNRKLNDKEIFYYAALIHAVFVNIHPFNGGNGRAARLLEKWFLSKHLGDKAWYIKSEKYYYQHINNYYKNLNNMGMFYEKVDYEKSLPFLCMLPNAINYEG